MDEFLLESQTNCIEILEGLIQDVRRGRVTEIILAAFGPDDTCRLIDGGCNDRHTTAGVLLDLAIERLKKGEDED